MVTATLTDAGNGSLYFSSTYDPALQADLKATVAAHHRAWDPGSKRWLIDPAAAVQVAAPCATHLGVDVAIPPLGAAAAVKQVRLVRVLYIGQAKWRADNSYTASAYVEDEHGQGRWGLVIPVGVLRTFFEGGLADLFTDLAVDDEWSILGLDRAKAASYSEADVKAAARRAKALSHPDRHGGTKEAHEHFLRVQEAGELLADPFTRHISLTAADEAEKDRQLKLRDYAAARTDQLHLRPAGDGAHRLDAGRGQPAAGRPPVFCVAHRPVRIHRGRLRAHVDGGDQARGAYPHPVLARAVGALRFTRGRDRSGFSSGGLYW